MSCNEIVIKHYDTPDLDCEYVDDLTDEPVAEGLNINAILALNHAISIKQHKMLTDMAREIELLKGDSSPTYQKHP